MSRARTRVAPGPRLIEKPPRVYVGPGALEALGGMWGLLLGAKRSEWIDVLELAPRPVSRWSALADCRLESTGFPWTIVGVSLPALELERHERALLRELVPGDVVTTERGAQVHLGDAWAEARVLREARAT